MKRREIARRYFHDDACSVLLDGPNRATGRCFLCSVKVRKDRGRRVVIYGVRSAIYVAVACKRHRIRERRRR